MLTHTHTHTNAHPCTLFIINNITHTCIQVCICVCSLAHTYTNYSITFHLNLQNPYNIKQRYGNSNISASRRQLLSLTRICLTYSHLFTPSHLSGINTCIRRYAATHLLLQYHLITVPQRKKEKVSSLLYLDTH